MKPFYYVGRLLQLAALIAMPAAILAGEFLHSERMSLSIFLGSALAFFVGWFLAKN